MSAKVSKGLAEAIVTFTDGEIKTYAMSASIGVAQYLADQVGRTGVLTIFNEDESYNIPISQVREWTIKAREVTHVNTAQ